MQRDHVSHYANGKIEYIDFLTEHHGPDAVVMFILMNIGKYAARGPYKGQLRSDLEKIRNYAGIGLQILDKYEKDSNTPDEPGMYL